MIQPASLPPFSLFLLIAGPPERAGAGLDPADATNLLLTLHPDYMTTVTIWPQDCGRTKLIAEWHFHPGEIAKQDFVFEDAVEFWDRTNREDWAISEQSYLGISSRGYVPGPYSEREKQLWEFDRFILSRLNANTNTQNHGATEPI